MSAQYLSGCSIMGTPASVISSPAAAWQAPEPRTRKKASANIFKDIDLLQIQTLFRTNGDELADERAQIIYNYAGDRHVADALIKLRRKKRNKGFRLSHQKRSGDGIGGLSVQNFSKLCIKEDGNSGEEDPPQPVGDAQERPALCGAKKSSGIHRQKNKLRLHQKRQIPDYLHQIRR
ncbi:arginine vasopressin-induced protein 1 [Bufo gargarizans]|uniref:arginine vasopressin-induced protein 1 n=1 Tax=Bufo gargarizans TaxID=30331 RepID=UPI001CF28B6C|nr:arginine vasopressin-induced protein 1 [Bufo gargarizans]